MFRKSKRKAKLLKHVVQDVDPEKLWKVVSDLGEGSFGMVHKVKAASDSTVLAAAKVIPVKYEEELEDFVVEVDILTHSQHPAVIGLHGAWLYQSKLWVVLELCEGGALDDVLIELERGFTEPQIRMAGQQMLEGLAYLHDMLVIHRDLKAGNVLLKADGTVKLTDFGVSAMCKKPGQRRDTFIGTPYWMAPEVVLCENSKDKPYDNKADVWSFGITLIEFAEMSPPYHDMHPMRVLFKVPKAAPPELTDRAKWSQEFHTALAAAVVKAPTERATARGLLRMPFFAGVTDKAPLRDLYRLFKADVTEVLEDLAVEQAPASAGPALASTAPSAGAEDGAGAGADATALPPIRGSAKRVAPPPPNGAPPADATTPASGLAAELVAMQHIKGAIDMAKSTSAQEDNLSKAVGDPTKNYKTLTRTRQYVNDKGEIITVSTQRVVETSSQSGKLMTIRRGMVNIDSDWKDAEAKRLALLRKAQLRETKRVQREEQKECAELIEKLRTEREKCEATQKKELLALEKELTREKAQAVKLAATAKSSAERKASAQRKDELGRLARNNSKAAKQFKQNVVREKKMMLKDIAVSTPRNERKDERRRALEAAAAKATSDELAEEKRVQDNNVKKTTEINQMVADIVSSAEKSAMLAEHGVVRACEQRRAQLLVGHMTEKQTMLKHQLNGTFWMQKHQMHFRHEKEADQLLRLQEQKLSALEKKFMMDQAKLPKRQRVAASGRRRELRKSVTRAERATKLEEFDSLERTRWSAEEKVLHRTYTETMDAMKEAMKSEAIELAQMQDTRKQLLVANEKAKTAELEASHAREMAELKGELAEASKTLEKQLSAQVEAHNEFYSRGAGAIS
mmetsp:Transcript_20452/g.53218  ORF Transcript_20452/g.53218 Transcript_20452/m.53218 type:complete len:855 (-) Transcript_20452:1536-4100(-)